MSAVVVLRNWLSSMIRIFFTSVALFCWARGRALLSKLSRLSGSSTFASNGHPRKGRRGLNSRPTRPKPPVMKVSLDWINTWLPLSKAQAANPQQVCDILTASGLEVEGLEEMPAVPGGLKGMVVGEVLTCEPHPNADRLRVTTVNVGEESHWPSSAERPMWRPVRKSSWPRWGPPAIPWKAIRSRSKGKIRGEVSMGMICAEDELGIGSDHDGILDP